MKIPKVTKLAGNWDNKEKCYTYKKFETIIK